MGCNARKTNKQTNMSQTNPKVYLLYTKLSISAIKIYDSESNALDKPQKIPPVCVLMFHA
jgi:hypothetical protein